MSEVTLRVITPEEDAYKQVWALREAVLRRPLGLSLRNEDLSGEATETIIAAFNTEQEVFGCLLMRAVSKDEVKLRQMAVAPEAQGRGIGMMLLQQAETIAKDSNYKTITLHARQTAVPFYERAGYSVEGDVFEEVSIPHLFMKKDIHAPMS